MTGLVISMWVIWGILVLTWLGIHLYCERLSENEDDQVILDDSFSKVKNEQEEIVMKISKIEPFGRIIRWLASAMTLFIIGYYIFDFFNQFK